MNEIARSYCNQLPQLAAINSSDCWAPNADADADAALQREPVSSSSSGSDISDELSPAADSRRAIDKSIDETLGKARSINGSPSLLCKREQFEVFPSLPDAVLEQLGLNGSPDKTRELSEEELEQKFISLSLAFTIDAATISNRCIRQRRSRDQTETNLRTEISRLVDQVHQLRPLCVDAETTEMLTALLDQADRIVHAVEHAAIAAERYGAIQHEQRLAASVQMMINHVHALKAQRDSSRRQLQFTRRVLQDTHVGDVNQLLKQRASQMNGHQVAAATKRRASIATISRPLHAASIANGDLRKITRRTSELVLRGGVLVRTLRPARMEFGVDLVNLRKNAFDSHVPDVVAEENEEVDDSDGTTTPFSNAAQQFGSGGEVLFNILRQLQQWDASSLKQLVVQGVRTLVRFCAHEAEGIGTSFFYACALICFSLSLISLGNILVEWQYERIGNSFQHWFYNAK